jgi:hypothetical protein
MIQICVFKEKKMEKGKETPPTRWPMEGSKLGAP